MRVTAAKIAANRANASKSTGPNTPEGKAASRGNALRHGLTANVAALPGEDQAELDAGLEAWVEETATHSQIAVEFAAKAFRSMVRVRRCERALDAIDAARVRRAGALWKVERAREVHQAVEMLDTCPSVAVPLLQTTAEGAAWLAHAWRILEGELEMGRWTLDHYNRAVVLLGLDQLDHIDLHAATQLVLPLAELAKSLGETSFQDLTRPSIDVKVREERRSAARRLFDLGEKGIAVVRGLLTEQIGTLDVLVNELSPLSDQDAADAESSCLIDTSPDGRLPRRYLAEADRQLHASYKLALEVERRTREALPAAPAPAATVETPPPPRNEAKAEAAPAEVDAPKPTEQPEPPAPSLPLHARRIDEEPLRQAV